MSRSSRSSRPAQGRIGARIGGSRGNGRPTARPTVRPAARVGLAVCGGVAVLFALAWADGGEEPIRPIVEPVMLPESAR